MENFNIILAAGLNNSNINGMNKMSGDVSEKRRMIQKLQQEIGMNEMYKINGFGPVIDVSEKYRTIERLRQEIGIYECERARNLLHFYN